MKLVLFGPPGSGKGTQASLMKERMNIAHISTGDLFRKNIKEGTELGVLAKSYIEKGQLVPDEVTINMLKDRLSQGDCKNGYILDGFPRNLNQAVALEGITEIDRAILIDQKYDVIIPRLAGRRVCKACGDTTNIKWPEYTPICPKCNIPYVQRDDDKEEVIKARLADYEKQTTPLIDFYKKRDQLSVVNASTEIEETYKQVEEALGKYKSTKSVFSK